MEFFDRHTLGLANPARGAGLERLKAPKGSPRNGGATEVECLSARRVLLAFIPLILLTFSAI